MAAPINKPVPFDPTMVPDRLETDPPRETTAATDTAAATAHKSKLAPNQIPLNFLIPKFPTQGPKCEKMNQHMVTSASASSAAETMAIFRSDRSDSCIDNVMIM
jgi:hypothetical protein